MEINHFELKKNDPDPFENVLPVEPVSLNLIPKSYTFNGKAYEINARGKYKKHIYCDIFSSTVRVV